MGERGKKGGNEYSLSTIFSVLNKGEGKEGNTDANVNNHLVKGRRGREGLHKQGESAINNNGDISFFFKKGEGEKNE